MFGGEVGHDDVLDDTWEWNGTTWTERHVEGPPARAYHAMAYDSARRVIVLFGGRIIAEGVSDDYGSDTWEWHGTAWALRGTNGPPGRVQHAMVYDSARGVTLLLGGYAEVERERHDTWEWDGTTWTVRTAPGLEVGSWGLGGYVAEYDNARDVTVAFGGFLPGNATWELESREISSDGDCDVDLFDLGIFQRCYGEGFAPTECAQFDLDESGDVDAEDFAGFHKQITGPTEPL
jgi:hypothetical protein